MSQMRFAVEAFTTTIEVILGGDRITPRSFQPISDAWAWCRASPTVSPDATIRAWLHEDRDPPASRSYDIVARDLDELGDKLSATITRVALDAAAGRLLLFHAAGMAHRESGAAAALIGPSGTGKTTLVRALAPFLDYLTDETVAVDCSARVRPYRKPLSVKAPSSPWKQQISPPQAGLTRGGTASPVLRRLIVLDRRVSGDAEVRVRSLGTAEGLEKALPEMSHFGQHPSALTVLKRLSDHVGGFVSVSYRDADLLAPVVAELLAFDVQPVLRRAVVDDALLVDGATLVLSRGRYLRLEQVGTAVWTFLETPRRPDQIASHLAEAVAEPVDVEAVVDELLQHGIIEHATEPIRNDRWGADRLCSSSAL